VATAGTKATIKQIRNVFMATPIVLKSWLNSGTQLVISFPAA
jgi:hypothetical protein